MSRIYFEDLPSTNTPRIAENFNKLNNVIISSTESNTGEEVWVQKGKNLFNKNNIINNYHLGYSDGTPTWDANMSYMPEYIEVFEGTQLTMSCDVATIFIIHYYDANKNFLGYFSQNDSNTSMTVSIGTGSGIKYVRCSCGTSVANKIQLEYGSSATSYEDYIDKKIYTKNSNDVYETFYDESETGKQNYSTSEKVIGTWLGEPLYRKIIYTSGLNNNNIKNIPHNISNLKNIIHAFGVATEGTVFHIIPSMTALSSYSSNLILQLTIDVNNVYVRTKVPSGNDLSSSPTYITLEYTKTTN